MTLAPSVRAFKVGLYEEHVEEAAFLYEQRHALMKKRDVLWTGVESFEERLEAHVDALVAGGDLALEVCRASTEAAEPGQLFAIVCVFSRHQRAALLAEVLRQIDKVDAAGRAALTDALKLELPTVWREHGVRALASGTDHLRRILATVIGFQRIPSGGTLASLLEATDGSAMPAMLWAAGRTRESGALETVRRHLVSEGRETRTEAMLAALRLHDREALAYLNAGGSVEVSPIAMGLAGDRSVVGVLVEMLRAANAPAVATALGLLGDPSVLMPLVRALSVESLAESAAEALYVITGAPLFDDAFVPEEMSEDELFDNELERYRASGELPARADGQPFGATVTNVSQDPGHWQQWLQSRPEQFNAAYRYRLGQMCSPAVLLDSLRSHALPKGWRPYVAEELLVRYGIDLPLEPDMPVRAQRAILRGAVTSVASAQFDAGCWYTFGHL